MESSLLFGKALVFMVKSSTNGYIKVFRMGFSAEIMLSGGKGG
jgi:hypothetical protein